MDLKDLAVMAIQAKKKSYSPYSHFQVGAALLTQSGEVYIGANIESAAYTPSNCAERTAFFKAVSEGEYKFAAIAVAGGFPDKQPEYCYPCGVCRQVMMEFCDPETFQIVVAKSEDEMKVYTLKELLPHGFGPEDLHE